MDFTVPDSYDPRPSRRKWLKEAMNRTNANAALLSFIVCRLGRGKLTHKTIIKLCSKQGFTPSEARHALGRLMEAGLIEYNHIDPDVFVIFNEAGEKFAQEVQA
ncbi:helix-turn-helix domain-containing protein [Aliidiomarina indica]|uniref:hypothetical protein n=1 Tax=Aliidiomarina indica TaxID=2749147 RepID=UPI00188E941B|nr:hypothetical protein [Aliidiomarina indica]